MSYAQKTFSMQATTPFAVALGQSCGNVYVLAKAECWVRVTYAAPNTVVTGPADPTPVAGAAADYIHLTANAEMQFGADPAGKGYDTQVQDPLTHVIGYAVAAGDLLIVGH
jgi:hypothetical protein